MATCSFQTPVGLNLFRTTSEPCASSIPKVLQTATGSLFKTITGYSFAGEVTLNDELYDVILLANVYGDYMSGSVDVTHRRTKIKIVTRLIDTLTSYPSLPVNVSWHGIKFSGLKDPVSINITDNTLFKLPTGARNTRVSLDAVFSIVDRTTNKLIAISKKTDVALQGSDAKNWRTNSSVPPLVLSFINDKELELYQTSYKLYLSILNQEVMVITNGVKTASNIQIINSADGVVTKPAPIPYVSEFVSCQYNTKFPWSNTFTIFDSYEPSLGLVKDVNFLPALPSVYHINFTITIRGAGA